jgi:hypothetical protein
MIGLRVIAVALIMFGDYNFHFASIFRDWRAGGGGKLYFSIKYEIAIDHGRRRRGTRRNLIKGNRSKWVIKFIYPIKTVGEESGKAPQNQINQIEININ